MDDFGTIRLHKKVIEKFKKYSKTVSTNYSDTLDYMIAFFKDNFLSPYDILAMSYTSYINQYDKRMDALISILRNMEKTQLIPTREMLESLFDVVEEEEPLLVEKKLFEEPQLITESEELTFYRDQYFKQQERYNEFRHVMKEFINKISYEKRNFKKDYFKLNLSKNDFENFRNKNNV